MEATITIQEFNALLQSEREDSLWEMLRTIAESARPEDIRMPDGEPVDPTAVWVGWR